MTSPNASGPGRTPSGERRTRPAIRATGRRQRRARCVSLFASTTSSTAACDRRLRPSQVTALLSRMSDRPGGGCLAPERRDRRSARPVGNPIGASWLGPHDRFRPEAAPCHRLLRRRSECEPSLGANLVVMVGESTRLRRSSTSWLTSYIALTGCPRKCGKLLTASQRGRRSELQGHSK